MLKYIAKNIFKNVGTNFLERILSQSIYKNNFDELKDIQEFKRKEDLWFESLKSLKKEKISFLEFGVWEGNSIKQFSQLNINKESEFYGFDSFYGLPKDWDKSYPKGYFSTDGLIPYTEDNRITFIKGWFQNTLPPFINNFKNTNNLFVHYDADLYSSTLFCLSQIDSLKIPYVAIFDEFYSHEMRALNNYKDAYGAKVQFLGKTTSQSYPIQVSCRITPSIVFQI
tara:strand:- start:342 stop:1019 length:678 start_codon:yes stop_codon:yes gene_type:complete